MANYLIFGAGHIGPAIVRYLIEDKETVRICIVDQNEAQLQALSQKFLKHHPIKKIELFCLAANDPKINELLVEVDIIIAAIPWQPTFELIKNTRAQNVPIVSITRPNYEDLETLYELTSTGLASVIVGCGLEPGLTEILAHHCIANFPDTAKLSIYCGGITTAPNPPVFYKQVFGNELPISERKAYQVIKGKLTDVARFSGFEEISLSEIGSLEAWHDGMVPWLIKDLNSALLAEVNQKTLRWLGFSHMLHLLRQLGFLKKELLSFNDEQEIIPYQLTQALLKKHIYFDHTKDRDLAILHIQGETIMGKLYSLSLKAFYDTQFNLSAMAGITGYTAAITAKTVLNRKALGLTHPEQLFKGGNYSALIKELCQRGVQVSNFNEVFTKG